MYEYNGVDIYLQDDEEYKNFLIGKKIKNMKGGEYSLEIEFECGTIINIQFYGYSEGPFAQLQIIKLPEVSEAAEFLMWTKGLNSDKTKDRWKYFTEGLQ